MAFRPYPLLTLLALPALALLLALGSWQVQRMGWKSDLIARYEAARADPAENLAGAICSHGAKPGRPVADAPDPAGAASVRLYGRDQAGRPGWRVFRPAETPLCMDADAILVETRFEPINEGEAAGVTAWRIERPPAAGPFTPPGDPASAEFYAFEAAPIAAALGLPAAGLSRDWVLAADDGALPAHLSQTPPERHFGYAATWFGLAIVLVAVYLAVHAARGRLRLRGRA